MPNNSIDPTLAPASARRVARQDDRRLVILVANSKGGCGKTTLATNLAAYFAHSGQAVTLLDLDPQQSATQWVRLREDPRVEALGWPADEGRVSLRLPLEVTVHKDRFNDADLQRHMDAYDARRTQIQPIAKQRFADEEDYGTQTPYTWSEDKARQYLKPERADFGAFVRAKGFKLE